MEINTEWVTSCNVAITVCDLDGKIVFMNEKAGQVFEKQGGQTLIGPTDMTHFVR